MAFADVEPAVEQRGVGSAESPVAAKKKKKKKKKKVQNGLPQVRPSALWLAKAGVGCVLFVRGRLAMRLACTLHTSQGRWRRHRLRCSVLVHGAFVWPVLTPFAAVAGRHHAGAGAGATTERVKGAGVFMGTRRWTQISELGAAVNAAVC